MKLERVELFASSRDYLHFALLLLTLLGTSLAFEYADYRALTRFDDARIDAVVLHQYVKRSKPYQVLKLRTDAGATFYMTEPIRVRDLTGYRVRVQIATGKLSFAHYLQGFFASGRVLWMPPRKTLRFRIADRIRAQHTDADAGALFAALFTATTIPLALREQLAAWGVSHLLAISGFHLGMITTLIFVLLHLPYRIAQTRWFPWRHAQRDLLLFSAIIAGGYVLFLGTAPSVMRAYGMMLVGLLFYDRGIRLISFQTLAVALLLLLALWPRLFFAYGFWLSALGVFYIFLFLHHFPWKRPVVELVGLHVWVYLMMLPWGLLLFGQFSAVHPASIPLTMLFVIIYPVVLVLHLLGLGGWLDAPVAFVAAMELPLCRCDLPGWFAPLIAVLSVGAIRYRLLLGLLLLLAGFVFIQAVDQVA